MEVETKTSTLESSFASQFSEVSGVMPLPRQCRALLGDNTTRGQVYLTLVRHLKKCLHLDPPLCLVLYQWHTLCKILQLLTSVFYFAHLCEITDYFT